MGSETESIYSFMKWLYMSFTDSKEMDCYPQNLHEQYRQTPDCYCITNYDNVTSQKKLWLSHCDGSPVSDKLQSVLSNVMTKLFTKQFALRNDVCVAIRMYKIALIAGSERAQLNDSAICSYNNKLHLDCCRTWQSNYTVQQLHLLFDTSNPIKSNSLGTKIRHLAVLQHTVEL